MQISYATRKLKKTCDPADDRARVRQWGTVVSKMLKRRLEDLASVRDLADAFTIPGMLHPLGEGERGNECHYAMHLTANWRLVFRPDHDPVPRTEDGGVDCRQVEAIVILEVIDYHAR